MARDGEGYGLPAFMLLLRYMLSMSWVSGGECVQCSDKRMPPRGPTNHNHNPPPVPTTQPTHISPTSSKHQHPLKSFTSRANRSELYSNMRRKSAAI